MPLKIFLILSLSKDAQWECSFFPKAGTTTPCFLLVEAPL
jgi:hypothetical protein